MCQLTNFGASNEEKEFEIGICAKNWARQVLLEILTFGLKSMQKVKVNWSGVKVNGYWFGSILGFRVESRVEQ